MSDKDNKLQKIWDLDNELKNCRNETEKKEIIIRLWYAFAENSNDLLTSYFNQFCNQFLSKSEETEGIRETAQKFIERDISLYSGKMVEIFGLYISDYKPDMVTENGNTSIYTIFFYKSINYIRELIGKAKLASETLSFDAPIRNSRSNENGDEDTLYDIIYKEQSETSSSDSLEPKQEYIDYIFNLAINKNMSKKSLEMLKAFLFNTLMETNYEDYCNSTGFSKGQSTFYNYCNSGKEICAKLMASEGYHVASFSSE